MIGEAGIYDAMPVDHSGQEYMAGVKDGIEASVRRFTQLRHNPQSQHVHLADGKKRLDNACYLRLDHMDEALVQMQAAADSVVTEAAQS